MNIPSCLRLAVPFLAVVLLSFGFALDQAFALTASTTPTLSAPVNVPTESEARLVWLRREIARHDTLYFKHAAPEISDAAYDKLKRELQALEAKLSSPSIAGDAAVGDDRTGRFPTYRHREPMLGLRKAYSEVELRAFYAKISGQLPGPPLAFTIEPKYDGLAISVTYVRGKIVRAVTRGNGLEGDDVTANARTIQVLPMQLRTKYETGEPLAVPDFIELRGEVYLPFAEFDRINRERVAAGEEPFAHPRNLAAGTLKLASPEAVATRKLAIVFYGVGAVESAAPPPSSQSEWHALIRAWGLPGVEFRVASGAGELWRAVQAAGKARSRLSFPTDGVVVKLDSVALQQQLGATDSVPNWAIAYKISTERADTRVKAITIQVGRTGVLTPVAELEPVKLAGTRIRRVALHNRDEIARRDIRVGDYVFIEKAGEIIPEVVGVNFARRTPGGSPYRFPRSCPICGTAVEALAGQVAVRCPNYACPAQVQRRLEHFVSKDCMNITGLGPAMLEKLIARGWVRTPADLYRLRRGNLLTLGQRVEKSTDRLLAAIERSKSAELWRVIHGLGIPEVGATTARELAGKCPRLGELPELSANAWIARGVSRQAADSLETYFARPDHRLLVRELVASGVGTVGSASTQSQ